LNCFLRTVSIKTNNDNNDKLFKYFH
jgi:hypothetical protein